MVRWLERFLWIVAVAAVSVYIGSVGESRLSQAYLDWEFTRAVELPVRVATRTDVIPFVAQPLGRLEIPSIALSTIFIEGVDDRALRRGVGHIPGTALPGMPGSVGLSAHRDTFFRRLGEIVDGDAIRITTPDGTYEYIVESSRVVDPDERVVLRDIGRPTLTLVTCYPFYYVGPAPKRFVVHASLVGE